MICFGSNPLFILILPLFFFLSSTFFSFSHAIPEIVRENEIRDMVDWSNKETPFVGNSNMSSTTTLILAANRTHRRDPLDGFNYYTGGWDITNEHYFSSVAFSAASPFIIAIVWFLILGVCLCCIFLRRCCFCCCRRKTYGYSRTAYALSLTFLILFTAAAIAGSVFLYTGQENFHDSTVKILSYVLKTADTTVENLRDVFNYLLAAKKVGVEEISLPPDAMEGIDQIQTAINGVADNLQTVTGKSSTDIQNFLDPIRISLIYVAAALLLLAFLGFLFSILGMQCLVSVLVIIGWILVAGTFILSGIFLLTHNVVADGCVAMDEWVQNPTANSALENILPRVDDETAQQIFSVCKGVTFQLVNVVNTAIHNFSNVDVPPSYGLPLYYNQSGPLVPLLCNPYNSNFTDRQCEAGEVDFNNATQVWLNYTCQVSESGICATPGRLTPGGYNQMKISLNVSYGLYRYSPFLVDLVDSTFVKETFSNISTNYCPGLIKYSKRTYVGFITSSSAVMLSLILWFVYARERRHRLCTKKLMARSTGGFSDCVKDP